jgi:predicted cupin superfamily sugar epimerase
MKKIPLLFALVASLAFSQLANAAENEITVTGEGQCAKCAMSETKTCQTAIKVTKDGKTVVYYLAQNDVSKAFHKNVCEDTMRVTATGTVKTEDGKQVMTVTKIAAAQ